MIEKLAIDFFGDKLAPLFLILLFFGCLSLMLISLAKLIVVWFDE